MIAVEEIKITEIDRDDLRNLLEEIGRYRMPFGLFGPEHYPPKGIPLCDLPEEYLHYFSQRTFPKGRLGELMKAVWDLKSCGADFIFDPIRKTNGGRVSVRKKTPKTDF